MVRINEQYLKLACQDVPDGLPVDAGGLHRYMSDLLVGQPIG